MVQYTQLFNDPADIQRLVGSLTQQSAIFDNSYSANVVGFLYSASCFEGANLPLSYWVSANYFGDYAFTTYYSDATGGPVSNTDPAVLNVIDVFEGACSAVIPTYSNSDPSGDAAKAGVNLQVERINSANGTDIYDSSTYQIALALSKLKGVESPVDLNTLIENLNNWLLKSYNGNDPTCGACGNNRAITMGQFYYYGGNGGVTPPDGPMGTAITTPENAYFYRLVTQKFTALDPFFGPKAPTTFQHYVTDQNFPSDPNYPPGTVTWDDWKPISGENIWGLINGPIRAWTIAHPAPQTLTPSDPEYMLAINVLGAFQDMQSKSTGGIYYVPSGTLGNTGSTPVNPFQISTENNASALGSLKALQNALPASDPNQAAIRSIMAGILNYFKNFAWNPTSQLFYTSGIENYDSSGRFIGFTPSPSPEAPGPEAVDVNTWGVAALTPSLVDTWFGVGTAYAIWQKVKVFGGFYYNQTLMGVGYSDEDHNDILSAEWTFGAINMVRCLMNYYGSTYPDLALDENSMVNGVKSLYSDNYPTADAFANTRPPNYTNYVPNSNASTNSWFIYASKRYFIPFGWFANPLPSLTSTSWALMIQYNYNPFSVTGSY